MKPFKDITMLKKYMDKQKIYNALTYNNKKVKAKTPYEYCDDNLNSHKLAHPLINRLSSYLLQHLKGREYVNLNFSFDEIARYLGTSYRTLNKTFKELESNSIISCKGKKVYVLDIDALKNLSKEKVT